VSANPTPTLKGQPQLPEEPQTINPWFLDRRNYKSCFQSHTLRSSSSSSRFDDDDDLGSNGTDIPLFVSEWASLQHVPIGESLVQSPPAGENIPLYEASIGLGSGSDQSLPSFGDFFNHSTSE
jgi:hypothetical protein